MKYLNVKNPISYLDLARSFHQNFHLWNIHTIWNIVHQNIYLYNLRRKYRQLWSSIQFYSFCCNDLHRYHRKSRVYIPLCRYPFLGCKFHHNHCYNFWSKSRHRSRWGSLTNSFQFDVDICNRNMSHDIICRTARHKTLQYMRRHRCPASYHRGMLHMESRM